jgi:hypothetical protein
MLGVDLSSLDTIAENTNAMYKLLEEFVSRFPPPVEMHTAGTFEVDVSELAPYQPKWEYRGVIPEYNLHSLNVLGDDGWEVCGVYDDMVLVKRMKE